MLLIKITTVSVLSILKLYHTEVLIEEVVSIKEIQKSLSTIIKMTINSIYDNTHKDEDEDLIFVQDNTECYEDK